MTARGRERLEGRLVLADGAVFRGEAIGAAKDGAITAFSGEVVFNTALSGYQEILTDPSYAGQVITFTYPHIGSYGVNETDNESARPRCRGVIVRELVEIASNWRAEGDLEDFLVRHGVGGLTGVDTRRLTRHLRAEGAMAGAFGTATEAELLAAARAEPGTTGRDLVAEVTTGVAYTVGSGAVRVVAYDYGIKTTILRYLAKFATVEVVPATTPAAEVLARRPDGVFLSNGPGDPAALGHLSAEIDALLGELPVFGICLGHQLLAKAIGASTYKLPFGHHGANHPVCRLASGGVEITSQNHSYAVAPGSFSNAKVTHVNLNDGVIEGLELDGVPAFSVQYHPEAAPGPHDATYLFGAFAELMAAHRVGPR